MFHIGFIGFASPCYEWIEAVKKIRPASSARRIAVDPN
ncbi:hypothetical protein KNP414_04581 [Paenibacillus mucilaginosus KNP414]|uniref:Uncharacterized protein n=1 Tax=Paenibacillus mucilaginosus (strain KNP414) TaxID=1036673 RepID=F8FBR0_PAEMK|nr:hypothetical protein KNP414_04581 [Paenibacillus mucilaginosus KNP414]